MRIKGERRMNQTIFENLPQKMNLISDLFSRVVFRDRKGIYSTQYPVENGVHELYSGRGI